MSVWEVWLDLLVAAAADNPTRKQECVIILAIDA